MADAYTIANSLRLAKGCANDASTLADQGSRNAAYLAEQALEQIIRAVATSEGMHIERVDAHQLDKVVRRFPADNAVKDALVLLVWLEAYATTFRYTLPSGRVPRSPEYVKLASAINEISTLIERLSSHFAVDLNDASSPAQNPNPIRARK